MLLVNADDWGGTQEITDRILTCFSEKRIHSSSAMVFMADSERAAELASVHRMPTGLHLNLDQALTGPTVPRKLNEHHLAVSSYLKSKKWNQILYNPFLRKSFDYVFQSQWGEFQRLYGGYPKRLDGHHHMHLCMNMLCAGKYPHGIQIRRNFTFYAGEKNFINRWYRYWVDRWLLAKYRSTDSFFSIDPINPERLRRLVTQSRSSSIEIMVHPGVENEFTFLMSEEWRGLLAGAAE